MEDAGESSVSIANLGPAPAAVFLLVLRTFVHSAALL